MSSSMALSYYSNWEAFQDSELITPQTELITPDYNYNYNYNQLQPFPDYQLFDPSDLFYSPQNPNSNSLLFNLDGFVQNPNNCYFPAPVQTLPEFPAGPPVQALPEFPAGPPVYSGEGVKKEASLSAQSVAARQRRRRITVKTQELGKLVPGGHKMNTAEMLQAAYKYIKFLQAQVGILEFAASYHQENGEKMESDEELKNLLESSVIQEKLYSSERCLVPKKFVQQIRENGEM